jgi:nucleotide-binding universal stress UspA family protein
MFKHILFPTDGAATSKHIIKECVSFAKDAGAVITALHVIPRYSHEYDWELNGETKEQFLRECVSAAEEFLEEVNAAARAAGVPCTPMHVTNDYAYDAIIRTAEEKHCDLIAMASHGRKGVKGMILGSETQKVLTHTKLPVLVFR